MTYKNLTAAVLLSLTASAGFAGGKSGGGVGEVVILPIKIYPIDRPHLWDDGAVYMRDVVPQRSTRGVVGSDTVGSDTVGAPQQAAAALRRTRSGAGAAHVAQSGGYAQMYLQSLDQ